MALNIKDPETDRLARELATATGQTITVALRQALTEQLTRIRAKATSELAAGPDLADIIRRGRDRAIRDHRDEDQILGYGDEGLPQ